MIAGDTVPCAGLDELCEGADMLVHTVVRRDLIEPIGLPRLTDVLDYHSSVEDAARTAARHGVGTLVLTHLVPAPSRTRSTSGWRGRPSTSTAPWWWRGTSSPSTSAPASSEQQSGRRRGDGRRGDGPLGDGRSSSCACYLRRRRRLHPRRLPPTVARRSSRSCSAAESSSGSCASSPVAQASSTSASTGLRANTGPCM